jgi:hypothetical protein
MAIHECKYDSEISKMGAQVDEIYHRMFIGNGTPATMTRIDRLERLAAVLIWVGSTVGGACIVAIIGLIVTMLRISG